MHFTLVVTALLSLVDLSFGWAQADNGVWVANNTYHTIRGGKSIHSIHFKDE